MGRMSRQTLFSLQGRFLLRCVILARQGHVGLAFKRELNPATVRHLAIPEQTAVTDVGLRDRFGRLLPEWPGSRAA